MTAVFRYYPACANCGHVARPTASDVAFCDECTARLLRRACERVAERLTVRKVADALAGGAVWFFVLLPVGLLMYAALFPSN